ncbi:MAG: outer membrane beta-barrel protein [Bacteroidetes bacterium]|nr:outer membrane beta-barrel protein [Bacteroidota bacterium]
MKFFFLSCLIFISIAVLSAAEAFSQSHQINQWVVVGARGSFNSTWLLNQNELHDKGIKYQASWGWSGGIMVGAHYSQWGAVYIEGLYSALSQKLSSNIDSVKWNSRTDLAYYEFPVLLHFIPKDFKYIEAGVKISALANAKSSYSSDAFNFSGSSRDNFEKTNFALVLGWGGSLWGDGGGLLDLGIRLTYGLSDITSNAGGRGKDYYPLADGISAKPKSYLPTNTATIGFHLTYDFDMGWWFHDTCKRKYKFFMFEH